jgi:hypothetical protein
MRPLHSFENIYSSIVQEDVKNLINHYKLGGYSELIQSYIASNSKDFLDLTDYIQKKVYTINSGREKKLIDCVISFKLKPDHYGGFDGLVKMMEIESKKGFDKYSHFIVGWGFVDINLAGHTLNQNIQYLSQEKKIHGMFLININKESPKYTDALKTAKDSQFKRGPVIELD